MNPARCLPEGRRSDRLGAKFEDWRPCLGQDAMPPAGIYAIWKGARARGFQRGSHLLLSYGRLVLRGCARAA